MIDKTVLHNKIHESANLLLADIQSMGQDDLKDNLKYFAEKAKDIAENILEEYIFSIVSEYTEGEKAITDSEILSQFINFNSGYQQLMLEWINNHPLEVKEEYFEIPSSDNKTPAQNEISPTIIVGAGTILAVGLFIFTNIWVALAAEILSLALAKVQKNRIANRRAVEIEIEKKEYEAAILAKKDELINGMISELEVWLDLGEKASNETLSLFNI